MVEIIYPEIRKYFLKTEFVLQIPLQITVEITYKISFIRVYVNIFYRSSGWIRIIFK
jgi:hypothetical protein